MPMPQVGQVYDGYRYEGGDPNDRNSWSAVGKADTIAAETTARERAKREVARDFDRLEEARLGAQQGYGLMGTAQEFDRKLARTDTGPLAPVAKFFGDVVGGTQKSNDLRGIERLANELTLGNAQGLKGALSDKDVSFLRTLAPSISAPTGANQEAVDAYEWAASRLTNYEAGLQSWTDVLGSPAAKNANGLTYDQWFNKWAAENIRREMFEGSGSRQKKPAAKFATATGPGTRPVKAVPAAPARPVTSGSGWKIVQE